MIKGMWSIIIKNGNEKYIYDNRSRLSAVQYPWTAEKAEADRKEAEEAGLYFTLEKGIEIRYMYSGAEVSALREILNRASPARGNAVQTGQLIWTESYTYDRNGNRVTKTTPWGTVRYEYDAENRLIKKGDVVYTNDKDGNTLSEKGLRYEAVYGYNGQNRMVYSEVTSHAEKTHNVSVYGYDALGRRTITQSVTGQTIRTTGLDLPTNKKIGGTGIIILNHPILWVVLKQESKKMPIDLLLFQIKLLILMAVYQGLL